MIYTITDVEKEIDRYFTEDIEGSNQDIIVVLKKEVNTIFPYTDILRACHKIRESFVDITDADGKQVYKDKKYLPNWIRYFVYVVIYDYLVNNVDPLYNQSTLLLEMGLYPDIFGKKHWCMYSPDMKARQVQYKSGELPINHSEIEANDIYRAMIHHILCYSRVLSDTFVDVFGKLGVIPAQCANGYANSQLWLESAKYKEFLVFNKAILKKKKVCKLLRDFQYEIKHSIDSANTVRDMMALATGWQMQIRGYTIEDIMSKKDLGFDVCKYAAYFIIQQYFTPEYWLDSRLIITTHDDGVQHISAELKDNLSKYRIDYFCDTEFDDAIETLSDAYRAKRFHICNIEAKNTIDYLYSHYEIYEEFTGTDVLYLDVPKYIREERRFKFDYQWYDMLFTSLESYKGDWILSWKNYVEVSSKRKSYKNNIYADMLTQGKIEESEYYSYSIDEVPSKVSTNNMKKLYDSLASISDKRQLYVYRYRNEDTSKSNSIVFITTIDFEDISDIDFQNKYDVTFWSNGELKKQSFEEFYISVKRTIGQFL